MRSDLLALSADDLAAVANRGLLKRAQREIEAGNLSALWTEDSDGTIRAVWSDGADCTLPGGKTLHDAQCTCGALEMCRHVLRTVLAWQLRQAAAGAGSASPKVAEPWNPGRIADATIESSVPKPVRERANALWAQGILGEALISAKPSMRFHSPGHTVRFPVPDDIRYAQCSCADPAPCTHAVLAVRAFRLLASESTSGIVSAGPLDLPVPEGHLTAAEACILDLLGDGFVSLSVAWRDRVRRVAAECAAGGLPWPAQILEEIADDFDRYVARDAAFTPVHTVERAGELLLRIDAIRAGRAPVPQAFIRGLKTDANSDLGAARFIGLGASISEERQSTGATVFLQDCDSGHVVTVVRSFTEDENAMASRKPFHQLARASAVKDASLALLASGQLVTQGGRRKASGQLVIGRARAVVNPQNFTWDQLKAPVLVEDFSELQARLRLLPLASFRPRRAAADFHVCPIATVEDAQFRAENNSIVGVVADASGEKAILAHPWSERGRPGAELLLSTLVSGQKPLFVAGHVRLESATLVIRPTAIVFAGRDGARHCVMPWIATQESAAAASAVHLEPRATPRSIVSRYGSANELLSDLVLNGLRRTHHRQWPNWSRAIKETDELGYHRMAAKMRRVQSSGESSTQAIEMLKMAALARDASA